MALDAANFISELSITDPPGTDPLSQGDDQIRTAKRSVFNSFRLIDKAVDISADQMNLMAIKNEANVFTADQEIQGNLDQTQIDATTGTEINFNTFTGGILRWSLIHADENAANPNAVGLIAFDVFGAFASVPWLVDPTDGVMQFDRVPTINGDPIWTAGEIKMLIQGAALPSTNWFVCNGTNGTVDLRDRIMGAQGVFTGTQTPFLDAATGSAQATGSHVLTVAQMPAHEHDPWVSDDQSGGVNDVGLNAVTVWGFGGRRNDASRHYDNRISGGFAINTTGGDGGHTHTADGINVETNGLDAFQVMPFTYFMQVIQYVP